MTASTLMLDFDNALDERRVHFIQQQVRLAQLRILAAQRHDQLCEPLDFVG